MRRSFATCIVLLAHATAAQAQGTPPADAPAPSAPTTGSLAGDVSLKRRTGEVQRMAERDIRLMPVTAFQAQASQCAVRDSSRAAYLRLRREARLAYAEANTSNEGRRNENVARGEAARAAASAAREPADAVEAAAVAWLKAHPASKTDANGGYAFDAVAPGSYVLYVDAAPTHEWFVPVTVRPGSQRQDLTETLASSLGADGASGVAGGICGYASPAAGRAGDGAAMAEIERIPTLANRMDIVRLMQRRYPEILRDAGVGGQAIVRARILPDGTVEPESVEALESSMEGMRVQGELESAAEMVVEAMRFTPAVVRGEAVPMWVSLPIVFNE